MAYSAPQLIRSQICRYESRLDGAKPSAKRISGREAHRRASAVSTAQATGTVLEERLTSNSSASTSCVTDRLNQLVREGDYEVSLVEKQANKEDQEQASIANTLAPFRPSSGPAGACVVGCGPAGLALAAELAEQGVTVALIGRDVPFVNNYGVWTDEFKALGLEHTLEAKWQDAMCYFGEGVEVRVGRGYGRVCKRALRQHLLQKCKRHGVKFLAGEVQQVVSQPDAQTSQVILTDGTILRARLVTLAAGAAAGKLLQYEHGAPSVAAQTAYGIECEVENYEECYDPAAMLFMDFRRHHSGVWSDTASRLVHGEHPAGSDGLWGCGDEVPSFLYAMPIGPGRVFLEETCLVAKPALPFATLKRRLQRRLQAMGLRVTRVMEEEWSYIPVGGPLPLGSQPVTAFGAAANLVHPATGYSIVRSLREAPGLAVSVAEILKKSENVGAISRQVWEALWPLEKRRQAAFHVFGMELLARLDLAATNDFFRTFFRLPTFYWRGFLASSLSSGQLIAFALLTYALAPLSIKWQLMRHLVSSSAGSYLVSTYLGGPREAKEKDHGEAADVVASPVRSP